MQGETCLLVKSIDIIHKYSIILSFTYYFTIIYVCQCCYNPINIQKQYYSFMLSVAKHTTVALCGAAVQ